MDAQLRRTCRQTVHVASPTGYASLSGQTEWGTAVARTARVESSRKLLRDAQGNEVMTDHRVILEAAVSMRDRFWLPGDDESDASLAREPIRVMVFPTETGAVDHYEVWL